MLPGLHLSEPPNVVSCPVISKIQSDFSKNINLDFSQYAPSACSAICTSFHLLIYLECSIYHNKVLGKETCSSLLAHVNPKVRRLALMLLLKHYADAELPAGLLFDPCHKIRKLYIEHTLPSSDTLLNVINDENVSVRCAALTLLAKNIDTLEIFDVICGYINDVDVNVRIIASKAIGNTKIKPVGVVEQLLSKQGNDQNLTGALVYGLEDENVEVRMNTLESLYKLIEGTSIPAAFEYFIDSLNDGSEKVRELTSKLMTNYSKGYANLVNRESLIQICYSIEENNYIIKENIIKVISNLRYSEIDFFEIIVSRLKDSIEPSKIYRCMVQIANNNHELIYRNIARIYVYMPVAKVSPALTDTLYVSKLVVLHRLRELNYKIKLDNGIKKHLRFIEVELTEALTCSSSNILKFLKDLLLHYSTSNVSFLEYKSLLNEKAFQADAEIFLVKLFYAFYNLQLHKNVQPLISLTYIFSNTCLEGLIEHIQVVFNTGDHINMPQNHKRVSLCISKCLKDYFIAVDLSKITRLKFYITACNRVVCSPRIPVKFVVYVYCNQFDADCKLKINGTNNKACYFDIDREVSVCIYDNTCEYLVLSVVKQINQQEVELSSSAKVIIERN